MRLYLRTEQQEEEALREAASGISVEDNAKKMIIKGKTFECAERRERRVIGKRALQRRDVMDSACFF